MNATMNATLNALRDWLAIAEQAVTTNTPRVFNAAMQEIATRALAAACHSPPTPGEAVASAGRIVSRPAFRATSPSLPVSQSL